MFLVTPAALEVVEENLAVGNITNNRVCPVWQLHGQTSRLAAEQLGFAFNRFGQREPTTSSPNGRRVSDFRLDGNDVAHADTSLGHACPQVCTRTKGGLRRKMALRNSTKKASQSTWLRRLV